MTLSLARSIIGGIIAVALLAAYIKGYLTWPQALAGLGLVIIPSPVSVDNNRASDSTTLDPARIGLAVIKEKKP